MAESEFPDVYRWISRLPPTSPWNYRELPLGEDIVLTARRTYHACVSFFISQRRRTNERIWLRRDIKWRNEEDSIHNSMQLITSPLFSFAIASISHAIHHASDFSYYKGIDLRKVAEDSLCDHSSITQSSNYPLLFNSAFASMCILIFPRFIEYSSVRKFISPEIWHPKLDIQESLMQILGKLFAFCVVHVRSVEIRKPLNWSYAGNTCDSCEVKIYCPLLSMNTTHNHLCELPNTSSTVLRDSLAFQQVECIVQLRYDLTFKDKSIHLQLGIHNVRCDVRPYGEIPRLAEERHLMSTERHFPSKISLTIAPQQPCEKISVSQSSANPSYQIAAVQGWEVSYQAPKNVGVKASGSATSTKNFNPWKFEQSAHGMNGTFKWILYDTSDFNGKQVVSSKPSKSGFKSAWSKDRYRKVCSPFTEEGGVVFASDNYAKSFTWTLNESREGQSFKVKIEGTIWVTYWPNLHETSFYESRYHEFSKLIELPLIDLQ